MSALGKTLEWPLLADFPIANVPVTRRWPWSRQQRVKAPSDFSLLRNLQGIIDLDAQIADRALQL